MKRIRRGCTAAVGGAVALAAIVLLVGAAPQKTTYTYDANGNVLSVQSVCVPTTCAAHGMNCGSLSDGCGVTLSCGTCATGQVCTSNVCCTPTTCAAQGKNCGSISDGCGVTLSCGTCSTGQVCTANVCCTPTTCAAQGKTCGTISNGCGGTLSCGTCGAGQVCLSTNTCCAPTTCAAQGWNCGNQPNGCGGTISCGNCPTGYYCDTGSCIRPDPCFVAGTSVAMADGSTKAIETVVVGDAVLSYDVDGRSPIRGVVTAVLVHPETPALLRINGEITTTPPHRFFASGRWTRADELRIGDTLFPQECALATCDERAGIAVEALELLPGDVTTYNLEISPHHTYFAGGVLVHNIKP